MNAQCRGVSAYLPQSSAGYGASSIPISFWAAAVGVCHWALGALSTQPPAAIGTDPTNKRAWSSSSPSPAATLPPESCATEMMCACKGEASGRTAGTARPYVTERPAWVPNSVPQFSRCIRRCRSQTDSSDCAPAVSASRRVASAARSATVSQTAKGSAGERSCKSSMTGEKKAPIRARGGLASHG
eukprot:3785459-Prymnesium_polylepis.1